MLLLALNFLLLWTAASSCECKLVDAMVQVIVTDAGNSVELPCDVPTTWPDNVVVTWTKYPAEKLSEGSAILVNDSLYEVVTSTRGEYNLKIFGVGAQDDGKYYCKFSLGDGQDTSIIKVYRLKVKPTSEGDSKRGRRNSGSSSSRGGGKSPRFSTSPRPTTTPNRWRTSSYDWRRNTTTTNRANATAWTRYSTYQRYTTKGNTYTANSTYYDSRRNASARPNGTTWSRNSSYGNYNRTRDYKTTRPVSTANWRRNYTAYSSSGIDSRRTRPAQFNTTTTTSSWRNKNSTRWSTRPASTTPARTTVRTTKAPVVRTTPTKATTKVATTVRRSSRLAQTTTTSRTTTRKNSRGRQ